MYSFFQASYSEFAQLAPHWQAFLAGCLTWALTGVGAAAVAFLRGVSDRLLAPMLGFAAGVMTAASFWSLLLPAIESSQSLNRLSWLPAAIGFVVGAGFLKFGDLVIPNLSTRLPRSRQRPALREQSPQAFMLVVAITLHNIPEGLAVGVAFGSLAVDPAAGSSLSSAIALSVGIGLQNLPEGIAVAVPLKLAGWSRWRSFLYGTMSAAVEPVAAVLGAVAVQLFASILPYALGFAAGAMIFVVVAELIPEAHESGRGEVATVAVLAGFLLMMILDVSV